jgi:hypothetical protein
MNHTECGRCGAEFGGITPLLEHYQEEHRGVPKAVFVCPVGCNTSAMETAGDGTSAQEELFTCVSECYNEGATRTFWWSDQVPSVTIRNRPLSTPQSTCRNALQLAERGPFCGMD